MVDPEDQGRAPHSRWEINLLLQTGIEKDADLSRIPA